MCWSQVTAIDQHGFGGTVRRYNVVRQQLDVLSGMNFHECPSCALGDCRVHIDGNMKMYNYRLRQGRLMQSAYRGRPGEILIPDRCAAAWPSACWVGRVDVHACRCMAAAAWLILHMQKSGIRVDSTKWQKVAACQVM
jgi:hypothetical protein